MTSGTTTVAGTPMRWEESGHGFPVVLIHGIPTSPALWRHVLPLLEGHALAWEMVGYGQSIPAGDGRDISVAAQAGHLLAWLDERSLEQVVVVGHDLGGGVAQIAATRAPDRFSGLVLTNSIAYDSWPIPSVKAMRMLAPLVARAPAAMLRAMLAVLVYRGHDDRDRAAESLRLHLRPYLDHGGAAAMARQVRALDVGDTLEVQAKLAGLHLPSRVVWGAADQFQKVRYGERLAADLGTELLRIEGGKHFTPEDHPEVVAQAVNAVIGEITGKA